MALNWHNFIYLVGGAVVYPLRPWFVGKVVDVCERLVILIEHWSVRTEREAVEWAHHRNRTARLDHSPKRVVDCGDGKCTEVTR